MADTEQVKQVAQDIVEKKPRKQRKAKEPAQAAPTPAEKAEKPEKRAKHRVEHEDKLITLTGKDVQLRVMTPTQLMEWGIKNIIGTMGAPCEQPLVIQFKSTKAAEKFFEHCLHYEEEDEALEFIDAGGRTEWYSDKLMDMMYGDV